MFIVKAILRRDFFSDEVLVEAISDIAERRPRLGWDLVGAPDLKWRSLAAKQGHQFEIRMPRGFARAGQEVSTDEAARLPGFKRLWRSERA